mmetsp:Transcript_17747/g.51619  ORF Transcript_17747/g.51619 Transcript_17747/m.51619 type:complete len:333 (+) Transcript_17747:2882-3880(+)
MRSVQKDAKIVEKPALEIVVRPCLQPRLEVPPEVADVEQPKKAENVRHLRRRAHGQSKEVVRPVGEDVVREVGGEVVPGDGLWRVHDHRMLVHVTHPETHHDASEVDDVHGYIHAEEANVGRSPAQEANLHGHKHRIPEDAKNEEGVEPPVRRRRVRNDELGDFRHARGQLLLLASRRRLRCENHVRLRHAKAGGHAEGGLPPRRRVIHGKDAPPTSDSSLALQASKDREEVCIRRPAGASISRATLLGSSLFALAIVVIAVVVLGVGNHEPQRRRCPRGQMILRNAVWDRGDVVHELQQARWLHEGVRLKPLRGQQLLNIRQQRTRDARDA